METMQAPNIEPGAKGRLVYDKQRRMIVGEQAPKVNRLKRALCSIIGHREHYQHPQQSRCICARCNDVVQRQTT